MDGAASRCKIVVVGDTQCGKTALLHVFAKDCYPEVRHETGQNSQQVPTTCAGTERIHWRQEVDTIE